MKTFLIFNKKTGEVISTRVKVDLRETIFSSEEAEALRMSKDDLLRYVDQALDQEDLDVLLVDDLIVGGSYRVDVKNKKVYRVEADETTGFGAGTANVFGQQPDLKTVNTVYKGPNLVE